MDKSKGMEQATITDISPSGAEGRSSGDQRLRHLDEQQAEAGAAEGGNSELRGRKRKRKWKTGYQKYVAKKAREK